MTTTAPTETRPAPVRRSQLRVTLRAMYDAVIGDPVRTGRLRLEALPTLERQLTIFGLVLLVTLLGALLFQDALRAGEVVNLETSNTGRSTFVPISVLPITLFGLLVAWSMILWGAVMATPPVTIATGLAFLLVNATLGKPLTITVAGSWALVHGPTVVRVLYFAIPVLMLLYTIAELRPRLARALKPIVLPMLVLMLVGFFGMPLWLHITNVERSLAGEIPFLVHAATSNSQRLLLPTILISFMGVIGFSRGVARAAATPLFAATATVAKALVLAFIAFKLWIQVGRHLGTVAEDLAVRPITLVRMLLSVALFAGAALLSRRFARAPGTAEAVKDRLVFGAAIAYATPVLIALVVLTTATFLGTQLSWLPAYSLVSKVPIDELVRWTHPIVWALGLGLGIWLMSKRDAMRRETGFGLALMSAWILPPYVFALFNVRFGFRYPLFDVLFTLALAAWLLVRWRRIDAAHAAGIGGLALFSWLVLTQGDFLSIIGGWIGLPAVVIVVVGVLFALVSDSSFASGDSRHFPRSSRPLMWVGYLLLSVTLLVWVKTTHVFDVGATSSDNGFFFLGIPLAAWLAIRDPFSTSPEQEDAEADKAEAFAEMEAGLPPDGDIPG